jgi:hypothetical protein
MKFIVPIILIITLILLAGCKHATGGGFLVDEEGGKSTFGFSFKCNEDGTAKGQLQFNDHENNVKFHGVVVESGFCADDVNDYYGQAQFLGTYTPQPKKLGESGELWVYVRDGGEPGPSNGDFFSLTITEGYYGSYSKSGVIEGGNIQVR